MIGRLEPYAAAHGKSLGVKFSNTLVVENNRGFFPASEKVMYLSGPPLHPLAIALVARFRGVFGDRLPVSFSGGVDEEQFRRYGRPRPEAGHRLQRPFEVRRLPARLALLRRARQAHGRRRREGHRRLRAQGAWASRGGARRSRPDARPAPPHAARRSADGGDPRAAAGDAFAAWVSARARAEQRGLRRARPLRPPLQRRRERDAAEEDRLFARAVRLPDLRQVHSRLSRTTPTSASRFPLARRRSSG